MHGVVDGRKVPDGEELHKCEEIEFYDYGASPQLDDDGIATATGQNTSHAVFCFNLPLTVAKTANVSFERHIDWTLAKTVSPAKWDLFDGDTGTSDYTVTATKTVAIKNIKVFGDITVTNNTGLAVPASLTSVSDVVTVGTNTYTAVVTCPSPLAPLVNGASVVCRYSASLPDGTDLNAVASNTAKAMVADGGAGKPNDGTVTVPVNLAAGVATAKGEPESITVDDTNGMSWTFTDSGTQTYPRTFACPADDGTHTNTVTTDSTADTDSADVEINCYKISVAKTADTSWKRTWSWGITKTVDQPLLLLTPGQTHTVNYTVTATPTNTDSDHQVSGSIKITNPAPMAATLTEVTDSLTGSLSAPVLCPSYSVPADGSLVCTYAVGLPDASARTNTATATQQHYAYSAVGTATENGTSDHQGTADVTFSSTPTVETDETVTIDDSLVGSLGSAAASGGVKVIKYPYNIRFDVCGDYEVKNTATLKTNDTATTTDASATVTVKVPCADGCTLTLGYWKTHSDRGPAPYDDAWKNIGALEEDTPFFLSGKTWYEVFWTPPTGNPYYQLAHQYMAAKLNILNGASTTAAVDSAVSSAETFFAAYTPTSTLTRAQRNAVIAAAGTLGSYNEGLIGPGHCSE